MLCKIYLLLTCIIKFNEINSSNAQPLITGTKIKNFSIPYTSKTEEQQAIASYLDARCGEIDALIAEKEALIADLEAYKKSLIFECVTGKQRVA